jgi:hypothetical protein
MKSSIHTLTPDYAQEINTELQRRRKLPSYARTIHHAGSAPARPLIPFLAAVVFWGFLGIFLGMILTITGPWIGGCLLITGAIIATTLQRLCRPLL